MKPQHFALPLFLLSGSLVNALSNLQLRILPLGDSITVGATAPASQGGYRRPLVGLLDGNFVNMVGSLSDGLFRDNQHEGWSGYGIAGPHNITEHFLGNGGHANPNVVIVHAGTNDIYFGNSPSSVLSNLDALLHDIRYLTPNAILILSHIGPWCTGTQNANNITAYNNGITNLVNQYQGQGWQIVLADVFGTLNPSTDITCASDGSGGVHPNSGGYNKIANLYYNTLVSVQNNNPSWFTTPANTSFGGTTGYYLCPTTANANATFVNPFSVTGLANSQNQYNGIYCTDVQNNSNICNCADPSGPNGSGYTYNVAKTRSCLEMTTTRTQAVIFADINGDGRADYLYVGPGGQVNSWLNYNSTIAGDPADNDQAGSVAFNSQGGIFGGAYGNRSQVRFADVNGDGLADYLQVFPNGAISAYSPQLVYSTSDTQAGPGFNAKGQIFNGTYNNVAYPGAGLTFADINGDSLADLVYVSFFGVITVFPNLGPSSSSSSSGSGNGFASFGSPQTIYTAPSGISRDNLILQDTNGDGHADLVVLNRTSGAFSVYENLGSSGGNRIASFNTTARYATTVSLDGNDGSNVQFANVGGNGRADWIDVNPSTSAFSIRSSACYITNQGPYGTYVALV